MQRSSFKPRQQPLARTTPLPQRTAPLNHRSAAHRASGERQRVAYATEPLAEWCAACGRSGLLLDHSHILTQHQHAKHRNNPLNWLVVYEGREDARYESLSYSDNYLCAASFDGLYQPMSEARVLELLALAGLQ